jgi:hypothetical protein
MSRFITSIFVVAVALSCASVPKPTKTQLQCAAACAGIDALECWDSPDLATAVSVASQFVTCTSACNADPEFSLELDPKCFVDRPGTCEELADCLELSVGK